MDKQARIKFTIPDAPPEKQIKMIKDLIEVMESMGKLTGEKVDISPFEKQIKILEKKVSKR